MAKGVVPSANNKNELHAYAIQYAPSLLGLEDCLILSVNSNERDARLLKIVNDS